MTRGRGRPPQYVHGRDGKIIVGLSCEKSSKRFYASHSKPRRYFGVDFDEALLRFRAWEAKQAGGAEVRVVIDRGTDAVPSRSRYIPVRGKLDEFDLADPTRSPDVLFAWARTEILRDPVRFSQRVGIPEVARLSSLPEPEDSLTLKAIGEAYFGKRRKVTPDWSGKIAQFWAEFTKTIGVSTLGQVRREHIERYHTAVWEQANKGKRSPTFVHHRLTAVRALLRCGLKSGRDVTNIRRVLDLCGMFELPKKNGVQPRPISPEDFAKLLDTADTKWRAILSLSLNCCLYPSEVSNVKKTDLDLAAGTYSATRRKTGIARVGVLWKRTVRAIKAYQAEEPHHSEYLFVSREGKPWTPQGFNSAFRTLRTRAGVKVQFASLRDGSFTAAVKAGLDQGRWLAGHRGGQADAYVRHSPELVKEACRAIEAHFFT